jgi:hypothetical protein
MAMAEPRQTTWRTGQVSPFRNSRVPPEAFETEAIGVLALVYDEHILNTCIDFFEVLEMRCSMTGPEHVSCPPIGISSRASVLSPQLLRGPGGVFAAGKEQQAQRHPIKQTMTGE